jgi:putative Mn2+ efflux pump MntP
LALLFSLPPVTKQFPIFEEFIDMTHLLSSFLLSATSNVDAFAVAIAYGMKKLRIGNWSNVLIAIVSTGGTVLSMSVGTVIGQYLPNSVANFLGSSVLIAIGLWGIWDTLEREKKRNRAKARQKRLSRTLVAVGAYSSDSFQNTTTTDQQLPTTPLTELMEDLSYESFLENPAKADKDRSGYIDIKESISLAFGLTINNLGGGVGAGISGLNIVLTSVLTFIFSILAIVAGYFMGDRLSASMTSIWTGILSGLLVIALGIYEYFVV